MYSSYTQQKPREEPCRNKQRHLHLSLLVVGYHLNRETATVVPQIAACELKKKIVYEEAWKTSTTHGLYLGEEDRQVCPCYHEDLLWDAAITNE